MNTKVVSDRDVETYDYRKAKNGKTGTADPVDVDIVDDCEELPEDDDTADVDICDRETFGTSTTTTTGSDRTKSSEQNHWAGGDHSRKRKHNGVTPGSDEQLEVDVNRPSARDRLSKRTYDAEKDRSHVHVGVNDAAADVARELLRLLGEPDHMKDTFGNYARETSPNLCHLDCDCGENYHVLET